MAIQSYPFMTMQSHPCENDPQGGLVVPQFHSSRFFLVAGAFTLATFVFAQGQRPAAPLPPEAGQANANQVNANQAIQERTPTPIPPEKSSVTEHDLSLGGKTLH